MSKIVVCPSSKDNLDKLLNMNIDGIVLGIDNLSVFPEYKVDIDKLNDIVKNTDKEIIVSINKMIHNKDIPFVEDMLLKLDKINISKIIFYDVGIINIAKRLGIKKDLVIYGEHLNTSILSNKFYKKHGVSGCLISNDITIDEIKDIKDNTNMSMMMIAYGYLPMFYSRRYLINNYFEYIGKEKEDNTYYMNHDNEYYMIKESEDGTIIYTKKPINLINEIDKLNNIDYLVLDGSYSDDNEFIDVVNSYINNDKSNKDEYVGFLHTKTIYKVKNNE